MVWDLDEVCRYTLIRQAGQRIPVWRYMPLILSAFASIVFGAIGSEFVQGMLPVRRSRLTQYKTFQWGDILANLAGAALGLYAATLAEAYYRTQRELELLYAPVDMELGPDESYDQDERPEPSHFAMRAENATDIWSTDLEETVQKNRSNSTPMYSLFALDDTLEGASP